MYQKISAKHDIYNTMIEALNNLLHPPKFLSKTTHKNYNLKPKLTRK